MAVPRRVVLKTIKGFSTLTLEGHALSMMLNRRSKVRTFEGVRRSDVALRIAEEQGYTGSQVHIDETSEVFEVISQNAETDAQLLKRLAMREGMTFSIDARGFHFRAPANDEAPTHRWAWRRDAGPGDLLSIHVESNLLPRVGKVTVKGRDPKSRTTVEATTTAQSVERTTLGEVLEVVDPETGTTTLQQRNATETTHPSPASTPTQVRHEAKTRFRRAERETMTLTIKVVGDPTIEAKRRVELLGISGLLSGRYAVRSVRHIVGASGYVCELRLTRDSIGRRREVPPSQQPSTGGAPLPPSPSPSGERVPFEHVDPETGETVVTYGRKGGSLGDGDPESLR